MCALMVVSILMQVFRQMCLLFYNILSNIRSKSLVWPSRAFGSIGTTRPGIMLLNLLHPFVNGQVPSSLAGWLPKQCTIMLLDIHGVLQWQKPSFGRYKYNVNSSFSHVLNKVGIGMCIPDEKGDLCFPKQNGWLHFLMWTWGRF